jgi:hypothetical protein
MDFLLDRRNSQSWNIWLEESQRAKTSDWLNSQPKKTWLEDRWIVKISDRLNFQPKKPDWTTVDSKNIWLAELPASQNLIERDLGIKTTWLAELRALQHLIGWTPSPQNLIGWTPSPSTRDWLNFEPLNTWLAKFPGWKNLIGRKLDIENPWLAKFQARKNVIGRKSDIENPWLTKFPAWKNLIDRTPTFPLITDV